MRMVSNLGEIWKDIKCYEGLYQVSNLGRVKSLDRYVTRGNDNNFFVKGVSIKPKKSNAGYYQVWLYNSGSRKVYSLHRLVAQTFIVNDKDLPQVNHINEIKTDNRVENLEWCTHKYNINYGSGIERRTTKGRIGVKKYTKCGKFLKSYESLTSVERDGFSRRLVHNCCKGISPFHKGFVWRFLDD